MLINRNFIDKDVTWMKLFIKKIFKKLAGATYSPQAIFHSYEYLCHNQKCLEHLARLGLPIAGASVLGVGAGIGDHTSLPRKY